MRVGDIELTWLGHSGFLIKSTKIIYIDPFKISENLLKADFILITHSHYDHCSIEDISKIVKDGTIFIVPVDVQSKVTRFKQKIEMRIMASGDELDFGNIKVVGVPAYNLKKQFHPKSEGWLGYVIKLGNTVIYHAGDTDLIPEMEKLTGYSKKGNDFVALLPVGGSFTMNYEEAAEAAKRIKATITIPMHYGAIIGNRDDANKFCEIGQDGVSCRVLDKEGGI